MKLYMYSFCSIDRNWDRLPTVKDFIKENLFKESLIYRKARSGEFYKDLSSSIDEVQHIAEVLKKCLQYAEEHMCWDNTFSQEPRIFFIPPTGLSYEFDFGFAWKIENNGATYIASPIELPLLHEEYGCFEQKVLEFK